MRRRRLFFAGAALVALLLVLRYGEMPRCEAIQGFVTQHGPWAPVVYLAIYVIGCLGMVPGALITMVAGAIYGPIWGTALALGCAVVGSVAAFGVARSFGRESVERLLTGKSWYDAFRQGLDGNGLEFVLMLRLAPLVPFNVANYACGLLPLRTRDYVLGSAVGMLPGSFAYCYFGDLGCQALRLPSDIAMRLVIASSLMFGLSVLPVLIKRRRR